MSSAWFRHDGAAGLYTLRLHVQPGARANAVVGLHGEALKVRIAAPAVENRANAALVDFLAETLGVARSAIAIRHGGTGRRKTVEIRAGPALARSLEQLASPRPAT